MIDHVKDLIEAGAASLKIEGRMKSVYYVAAVVAAYRKAIDADDEQGADYKPDWRWRAELEKVSHRPYTTAFAFQNPDYTAQEYEKSQPVQSYDFVGLVQPGQGKSGRVTVQQRNHFTTGETLEMSHLRRAMCLILPWADCLTRREKRWIRHRTRWKFSKWAKNGTESSGLYDF